MINILVSVILVLALKWAFLFVFEPKRERGRPVNDLYASPDGISDLVESHDGPGIGSSLGSQLQGLIGSHVGEGDVLFSALRTTERFMKGR